MADWVVYDAGAAAETLPPSLSTAYAAWLTAEVRAQRLGLVVSPVEWAVPVPEIGRAHV